MHDNRVAPVPPSWLWDGINHSLVSFCCQSVCLFYLGGFFYYYYFLNSFRSVFFWFRSSPEIKLTHEQQRILNHEIKHGQIVKIMAFAGKSQKLCCKNKCITSNSAPSLPAYSVQGTVWMPGGSTLRLNNTKNQSKLLQRNRNGQRGGGYSHASWVNVVFGHNTETECLGAVDDRPEQLVIGTQERRSNSPCVAQSPASQCYCPQATRRSRSYLFRFSISVRATQAEKYSALVHCFEKGNCIKLREPI